MEKLTDLKLQKLIKFFEIIGILKRTSRRGWVDIGIYQPESVADHSLRTTFLCMLYGDIQDLDTSKLMRMALIHDLPEAITGDLMPSQKSVRTKENEEHAIKQIFSLLPEMQKKNYLAVWNEYQEGKTKEANAMRQLDKIEMALQAKEYQKFGASIKRLERLIKSALVITVWPDLNRLLSIILEDK
jgi:putative hydrolase of HD superfamily